MRKVGLVSDESPRARRSIRGKLNRLVLVGVGVALGVAGLLNIWNESERYLASKRQTLVATAQVFSAASSQAVAAGDAAPVRQALRSVGRIPGIIYAGVEDVGGATFAEIGSAVRLSRDTDLDRSDRVSALSLLSSRTVKVSVPIVQGGERVGRLVLVSDTADLLDGFESVLISAGLASAVALALGLLLSHRLQRSITTPLVQLADAMTEIGRTKSYRPVIDIRSNDEVGLLATRFNGMLRDIDRATAEILARESEIIERLARAGEQRDDQTGQHVVRVARISRIIAEGLGLDTAFTDDLVRASPMHDVGKISIPDAILFKPGRLDPDERREMEKHAERGYEVLAGSSSELVRLAAEIALTHHEHWNGQGYPRGLAGEAIALSGRITAVADVCDALLSERPYKKPWTLEQVRAHLEASSGSHFDPACVAALLLRWEHLTRIYRHASDMGQIDRKAA